jgi:hypothetical protein
MLTLLAPERRQRIADALIRFLLVVSMMICLCASYHWLRSYHSSLPRGCDVFGYLYQSEAIREGRLLDQHTNRPWIEPLAKFLDATCPYDSDYMWMLTPHAYHYLCDTGKVVNQYPPGTAFVLAPFPKEIRGLAYPVLVTASLALLLAFSWRKSGWELALGGSCALFVSSTFLILHPFVDQYRQLGSVAMTFAPLIAAGWMMRKHPLAGLALASFTVLFRISNVWLLPVLALPYVFAEFFDKERWIGFKPFVVRCMKGACVCLVCGTAWILLYQWLLLGNPLRFTYSPIDQAGAQFADILKNVAYYLNPMERNWFTPHLVAFLVMLFVIPKGKRRWLLLAFAIIAWNYLFYITHKVTTPYYTYASALILIGLCFSFIEEIKGWKNKTTTVVFVLLSILSIHIAFTQAYPPEKSIPQEQRQFADAFAGADVTWADISTGTIEYATGIPSLRISWGTEKAVTAALRWFADHGYTQAIMMDDVSVNPERVRILTSAAGLECKIKDDANLKRIAWIYPEKKAAGN